MKIIRFNHLKFIPASHEDKLDPGSWKKVLLQRHDLTVGQIQMINWAKLPVGKAFTDHFHQDLQEVFIILSGTVKIIIDSETNILNKGDTVVIPIHSHHQMENISRTDVSYLAIGISNQGKGRTIVV